MKWIISELTVKIMAINDCDLIDSLLNQKFKKKFNLKKVKKLNNF